MIRNFTREQVDRELEVSFEPVDVSRSAISSIFVGNPLDSRALDKVASKVHPLWNIRDRERST